VEEAKARAELALSKLAVERARSRLTVSRSALSSMWADSVPAFSIVRGDIAKVAQELPPLARLQEAMTRSPEWARWTDDIQAAEHIAEAERRRWVPDLRIGAGIRQSQADNSQAYIAGVSMDLPVFDRGRGSVRAAEAELERKHADREAAYAGRCNELAAAHELLTAMQKAAGMIARDALPAAEQAFAAAQASYAGGKTGYLDVQDARRSLIDMRRQQTETLVEYHRAVARVERLAGTPLNTLK
jgi:cobalt-zinc-cadmium efflux system outer membrane protein